MMRLYSKAVAILLVTALLVGQSGDAFAGGRHRRRHRATHRRFHRHHHALPLMGGLVHLYYHARMHDRHCPKYVIANAPVRTVVMKSKKASRRDDKVVIHIPDSDGGYTAVPLEETKGGYIGPQGEYYPGHPTVEQLAALYGN